MSANDIKHNEDYQPIIHGKYHTYQLKTDEVINLLVEYDYNKKYPQDVPLEEQQQSLFKEISLSVTKTSSRFDLDSVGKKSNFDDLIHNSVIQKNT